jgi:hypothetical protein
VSETVRRFTAQMVAKSYLRARFDMMSDVGTCFDWDALGLGHRCQSDKRRSVPTPGD